MPSNNGVIIEYNAIGNSVKVSAIHIDTGVEVSIVGPANHPQSLLESTVLRKLKYVMEKNQS